METEEQRRARLQQAYQAYSGVPYADPAAGMSVDPAMSAPPPEPAPMVPLANDPQVAAYAAAQQPAPAGPPASMAGGGNGASGSWAPEPNGASGSWESSQPAPNHNPYGALVAGNIDLANRPRVRNADGSISTVRSMGVNFDGKEYLIPTVSDDGRIMSDDEAINYFQKTGRHLGVYGSPEEATRAAEAIHNDQAKTLGGQQPQRPTGQRAPARPTLYDEQAAMAGASRDAADQARIDADVGVDMQAGYTELLGEQKATQAAQAAELVRSQQAELERIGKETEDRRRVKMAVAEDIQKRMSAANEKAARVEIRDRRSTGRKVMGALAIGLGQMTDHNNLVAGLMQGMNVQTNNAEQISGMINASIERDLEMQRLNLANDRDSAAALFSELGVAQGAVKDVDAQDMLAKAAIADKYALSLDALSKQGLSEQVATAAAQEAVRLRTESATAKASVLEQQAVKDEDRMWALQVQREQERKAAAAAKATGKGTSPLVADLIAKEQAGKITAAEMDTLNKLRKGAKDAAPEAGGAQLGQDVPGGLRVTRPDVYKQLSEVQRKNLQDSPGKVDQMVSLLDEIIAKREDSPVTRGIPYTDANDELDGLGGQLTMKAKEAFEMGALDNGVIAAVKGMAGDATGFRGASTTKLRALKATVLRDAERKLKANGVELSRDTPYESTQAGMLESKVRPLE